MIAEAVKVPQSIEWIYTQYYDGNNKIHKMPSLWIQ